MFSIRIYDDKLAFMKNAKYKETIKKCSYFKHITKYTVYTVNFMSNIQIFKI